MNKTISALLILSTLISFSKTVNAKDTNGTSPASKSVFIEPNTKLDFPKTLGSLEFIGLKKYRNPALGAKLRYSDRKIIKADIYIYNLGYTDIGHNKLNARLDKEVTNTLRQYWKLEKKGVFQNVHAQWKDTKLQVRKFKIGTSYFLSLSILFDRVTPGSNAPKQRESHVLVTSRKNHFVKVIFTYAGQDRKLSRQYLKKFMFSLSKVLD